MRAFPFGQEVEDFPATHERIFVVEQNRDAQLKSLLIRDTQVGKEKLRPVLVYGGFPLSSGESAAVFAKRIGISAATVWRWKGVGCDSELDDTESGQRCAPQNSTRSGGASAQKRPINSRSVEPAGP